MHLWIPVTKHTDRPAISTWEINADTSICIRQAGIMAAKGKHHSNRIEATIMSMNENGKINLIAVESDLEA
jgi:hypothetical protein